MDSHKLRQEYHEILPLAQRFCKPVKEQIEQLLSDNAISLGVPIDYRVINWLSVAEKIERKGLEFKSLKELEDLVGLRVILIFKKDLEKICKLISDSFVVVKKEDT